MTGTVGTTISTGPGTVSDAPNLTAGFTDTFTSRFVVDKGRPLVVPGE